MLRSNEREKAWRRLKDFEKNIYGEINAFIIRKDVPAVNEGESIWKILCHDDVLIQNREQEEVLHEQVLNRTKKKSYETPQWEIFSVQVKNKSRLPMSHWSKNYCRCQSTKSTRRILCDPSMMSLTAKSFVAPSLIIDKLFVICSIRKFFPFLSPPASIPSIMSESPRVSALYFADTVKFLLMFHRWWKFFW